MKISKKYSSCNQIKLPLNLHHDVQSNHQENKTHLLSTRSKYDLIIPYFASISPCHKPKTLNSYNKNKSTSIVELDSQNKYSEIINHNLSPRNKQNPHEYIQKIIEKKDFIQKNANENQSNLISYNSQLKLMNISDNLPSIYSLNTPKDINNKSSLLQFSPILGQTNSIERINSLTCRSTYHKKSKPIERFQKIILSHPNINRANSYKIINTPKVSSNNSSPSNSQLKFKKSIEANSIKYHPFMENKVLKVKNALESDYKILHEAIRLSLDKLYGLPLNQPKRSRIKYDFSKDTSTIEIDNLLESQELSNYLKFKSVDQQAKLTAGKYSNQHPYTLKNTPLKCLISSPLLPFHQSNNDINDEFGLLSDENIKFEIENKNSLGDKFIHFFKNNQIISDSNDSIYEDNIPIKGMDNSNNNKNIRWKHQKQQHNDKVKITLKPLFEIKDDSFII